MAYRLLHIDDDPIASDLVRAAFASDENIEVVSRRNALDALSSLSRIRPDLIITDLMMPEMGGLELTNTLRQNPDFSRIPIIILSSRSTQLSEHTKRLGQTPLMLDKPVDPQLLRDEVRTLLQSVP